jgi:hypothetical protein
VQAAPSNCRNIPITLIVLPQGSECNGLFSSVDLRRFVDFTSLNVHLLELFASVCGYEAYECATVC